VNLYPNGLGNLKLDGAKVSDKPVQEYVLLELAPSDFSFGLLVNNLPEDRGRQSDLFPDLILPCRMDEF
jgi:hypothetical protein